METRRILRLLFVTLFLLGGVCRVHAFFPFSFGKQELKTDYSQTVWDQIMRDQARTDIRRGMGEMSQARYQEASNSFAKAIVKNTKDPLGYLLLGASLYWAGKVDDAISEYKEALRHDPHNPMAYQLLGIAAGWKGDVPLAQDYFLKANRLDPNKADTQMNLGSTYAVQHNREKALEHFRRATELAPREPLYHYQLGTLYESLGRDAQAEKAFRKALRLFPAYEDAQLSLGALYEKMGQTDEALKYYKKAVRTKPGDYVARLRYAFLLVRNGRENTAREVIEEAFSVSRFKEEGLALNAVYRASGRTAQAFENQIEKFKESLLKVSPSKPIQVEVSLEYEPVAQPQNATTPQSRFEQAYEKMRAADPLDNTGENKMAFKRMFTLPAGDRNTRAEQAENFAQGIRQALQQSAGKYQVNLSMQGRTPDYASPSALTQHTTTAPKAVYDPRIVGNDMGLWVMGRTWIKFVQEAQEELAENLSACKKGNTCLLLEGLASLASGDGYGAQAAFEKASLSYPADALPLVGLGTAFVVNGDDASAAESYKKALAVNPNNKTAKRNLKILED
ncbi:MAG: tetratricopeptide repeat protein [Elusimicrobium sp.]|uniref:Tetratricopeptide repeat protein n=1 Tax=Candidatus Avelusimicrobium gallicola TaxID=2562704 RepID=A0A928DMK6_9BACT|nr:tetratricopeptide repeat protein [Elusimicrobium sp.]